MYVQDCEYCVDCVDCGLCGLCGSCGLSVCLSVSLYIGRSVCRRKGLHLVSPSWLSRVPRHHPSIHPLRPPGFFLSWRSMAGGSRVIVTWWVAIQNLQYRQTQYSSYTQYIHTVHAHSTYSTHCTVQIQYPPPTRSWHPEPSETYDSQAGIHSIKRSGRENPQFMLSHGLLVYLMCRDFPWSVDCTVQYKRVCVIFHRTVLYVASSSAQYRR